MILTSLKKNNGVFSAPHIFGAKKKQKKTGNENLHYIQIHTVLISRNLV